MKTQILNGDCIEMMKTLPDKSVNCCVTSPPYFGLRDYGNDGQIGLEETPEAFVQKMVEVFSEVKRVLRDDGTLWLNLGDSYAGSGKGRNADGSHQEGGKQGTNKGTVLGSLVKTYAQDCKSKDLIGIPWMVAFALRADGWYLRQDIIWHKPNPMPESVQDRCTKAHEYIFLLSKSSKYYYDIESIKEPVKQDWGTRNRSNGKYHNEGSGLQPHSGLEKSYEFANKRSVWSVNTSSYEGAHFATFPTRLIEPCILAGCPKGGVVLDPFGGSGTTALVANENNRDAILCELNPEYIPLINDRLSKVQPSLF
jgi:DNA modification methylase